MQQNGETTPLYKSTSKDSKKNKWESNMQETNSHFPVQTVPTRVDLIRIWLKVSVDVLLEKEEMDQTLQTNTKAPMKRNMISGADLETLCIDIVL